ncbi:MAG: ABC transporter permease [Vallitaleaceae bacterium]|jgi:osmoprotectant transport system permease protein|nr:ABC transporter permease [Vallitaleaceae bacterium]
MGFLQDVINLYISKSDFFIKWFLEHLAISGTAIGISTLLGLSIGVLITYNERASQIVLTIINFTYTIPTIAFFGLLMSWTGLGAKTALIVIVIYSLLPITRNVYVGIKEVDFQVIEAAKAMGSTTAQILFKVQLPMALPVIIAGFRTMVVMVIAMTSIAAFIGAGGLGVAIWRGITTNNMVFTFAGSILVAIVAIFADTILGLIQKKITIKVFGK